MSSETKECRYCLQDRPPSEFTLGDLCPCGWSPCGECVGEWLKRRASDPHLAFRCPCGQNLETKLAPPAPPRPSRMCSRVRRCYACNKIRAVGRFKTRELDCPTCGKGVCNSCVSGPPSQTPGAVFQGECDETFLTAPSREDVLGFLISFGTVRPNNPHRDSAACCLGHAKKSLETHPVLVDLSHKSRVYTYSDAVSMRPVALSIPVCYFCIRHSILAETKLTRLHMEQKHGIVF